MIVDTDVLIWYSRGDPEALDQLHTLDGFGISSLTYMELIQGVRNKKELKAIKKAFGILKVKVNQINELISTKAMFFIEQYALSHSMELADALIGATTILQNETLLTANSKHYRHLPELQFNQFVPRQ